MNFLFNITSTKLLEPTLSIYPLQTFMMCGKHMDRFTFNLKENTDYFPCAEFKTRTTYIGPK